MSGVGTSLISSGAGATVSTALGIAEYYQGKKMLKKADELAAQTQRPTYAIPLSIEGYMSDAQKQAALGMPEEQRKRYLDQIARTQAYSIAASSGRGGMLQGVAQSQMASNDALANLAAMDNQQRQQNIQNLQNARLNYAGYQDKAFAYNQDAPYQANAAAVRALRAAGDQAQYAGAQTVANAGSNFAGQAGSALSTIDTQGNGGKQANVQQPVQYYNTGYQGYMPYGSTYNTSPPQPQAQTVYQYNVNSPNTQTTPDPYVAGYGTPYNPR